jgi:hypothetical protein
MQEALIDGQSLGRSASQNGQKMDSIDSVVDAFDFWTQHSIPLMTQFRYFDTPVHSLH